MLLYFKNITLLTPLGIIVFNTLRTYTSVYSAIIASSKVGLGNLLAEQVKQHKGINLVNHLSDTKSIMNQIFSSKIDVLIIGADIGVELMNEVLRVTPVPMLYVCQEETEHDIFNIGFVDKICIDDEIPSMFMIKVMILAKLNLEKFKYQLESYLRHQPIPKLKIRQPVKKTISLKPIEIKSVRRSNKIIVLGASTGGPRMIQHICRALPNRFPPILVVQHMPSGFMNAFAERMDSQSKIKIKIAEEGEEIYSNTVYIAPGGLHLMAKVNGGRPTVHLSDDPPVNFVRPSVDVTLFSAVEIWKNNVLSVILTGMGKDGLEGTRAVKEAKGNVIALNEEDSVVYGMNKSIIDAGLADVVVSLKQIPGEISKIVSK